MDQSGSKKRPFFKTRIVATIGPASEDEGVIARMIQGGMRVARFNFSHGNHESHAKRIQMLRRVAEGENQTLALLQDLSGPKIRLTAMKNPLQLSKKEKITLSTSKSEQAHLYTDFQQLPSLVKKGHTLLIDDGSIEIKVLEVTKDTIRGEVIIPGIVHSRKGINLPDVDLPVPVVTDKDKKDLKFGLEQKMDMVAMSYVDSGDNIIPIKKLINATTLNPTIIAKIERPLALKNMDSILNAFDGIMIARGDLGVEIPPEKVPILQKELLKSANLKNRLTITATQMLESMIHNPRPTRAEASDVSNAILDGSDAVMLSGETAVGRYPVRAVNIMRRIAQVTENSVHYHASPQFQKSKLSHTEAIVRSAVNIARELRASGILVFSFTGNTALIISKYRPHCPVFAFTSQKQILGKMISMWGIMPQYVQFTPQTDKMIQEGEEQIKQRGLLKKGDLVVIVSGPTPMRGSTNMLKLSRIK